MLGVLWRCSDSICTHKFAHKPQIFPVRSAYLSAFCSAAEMSFCRSCCFLSLSFFRISIFFSSANSISSSCTCSFVLWGREWSEKRRGGSGKAKEGEEEGGKGERRDERIREWEEKRREEDKKGRRRGGRRGRGEGTAGRARKRRERGWREGTKRRVSINFMIYKHVFSSDRLSSLSSCSFLFCSWGASYAMSWLSSHDGLCAWGYHTNTIMSKHQTSYCVKQWHTLVSLLHTL